MPWIMISNWTISLISVLSFSASKKYLNYRVFFFCNWLSILSPIVLTRSVIVFLDKLIFFKCSNYFSIISSTTFTIRFYINSSSLKGIFSLVIQFSILKLACTTFVLVKFWFKKNWKHFGYEFFFLSASNLVVCIFPDKRTMTHKIIVIK